MDPDVGPYSRVKRPDSDSNGSGKKETPTSQKGLSLNGSTEMIKSTQINGTNGTIQLHAYLTN